MCKGWWGSEHVISLRIWMVLHLLVPVYLRDQVNRYWSSSNHFGATSAFLCPVQAHLLPFYVVVQIGFSVSHRGARVVVEANHICMISKVIEKIRSSTTSIVVLGHFLTDSSVKASFSEHYIYCWSGIMKNPYNIIVIYCFGSITIVHSSELLQMQGPAIELHYYGPPCIE